jgi:protein TonB
MKCQLSGIGLRLVPRHLIGMQSRVVAALSKPADKQPKSEAEDKEPSLSAAQNRRNGPAQDSAPSSSRQATNMGAAAASQGASQTARTNYGTLLSAEIARHKVYPEARAAGATGSVSVVLTVGPTGRIVSHAITRSSGDAAMRRSTARSTP